MRAVSFLSKVGALKGVKRTGWGRHGIPGCESVADHSFRVAIMCMIYANEFGVDEDKCVKMALLHDIHEAESGDLVQRRGLVGIPENEKRDREEDGFGRLSVPMPEGAEIKGLWLEAFERSTPEAIFVDEMDKLEMALQALEYGKAGTPGLGEFIESARESLRSEKSKAILGSMLREYGESK